MTVKMIVLDPAHIEVLDRGSGVSDQEVARIRRWLAVHLRDAQPRDRIAGYVLERRSFGGDMGDEFKFVLEDDGDV